MREKQLLHALGEVNEQYIEEAAPGRPAKKQRSWVKWVAVVACLCLGIFGAGLLAKHYLVPPNPQGGITVSKDGVTIPPVEWKPSEGVADMMGLFVYQGRVYREYEWLDEDVDFVGEYLGTVNGTIDEWTKQDDYVEWAGTVSGDVYTVEGMNPNFMLCMKWEDGSVQTYINNNGLILKTGADLFETRLNLTGNYEEVKCQTASDWFRGEKNDILLGEAYDGVVAEFVSALNEAPFMRIADIPLAEGQDSVYDREQYHVFFRMNNGITVHLRLMEGGYVWFQGLQGVCVQVEDAAFEALMKAAGSR